VVFRGRGEKFPIGREKGWITLSIKGKQKERRRLVEF
jgi:hypothetical protein